MTVRYDGIRLIPAEVVGRFAEERPHVLGQSVLSESHALLVTELIEQLRKAGLSDIPRRDRQ